MSLCKWVGNPNNMADNMNAHGHRNHWHYVFLGKKLIVEVSLWKYLYSLQFYLDVSGFNFNLIVFISQRTAKCFWQVRAIIKKKVNKFSCREQWQCWCSQYSLKLGMGYNNVICFIQGWFGKCNHADGMHSY